MSKEQDREYILTRIKQELGKACNGYEIINKDMVKEYENRLYGEKYIPRLLLYELDDIRYVELLKKNGLYDEYLNRMLKLPHKMHRYCEIQEFVRWVGENEDYRDIMNKDEYDDLEKMMDGLKSFYNDFMMTHLNEKIGWEEVLK